jgi:hypothetical protein
MDTRWAAWSTTRRIWTVVAAVALALLMWFTYQMAWFDRGKADAAYETVAATITSVVGSPATSSTDGWEPAACVDFGPGPPNYDRNVRSSVWELGSEVDLPSVFAAAERAATVSGFDTFLEPVTVFGPLMSGSAGLYRVDYSLEMATLRFGLDTRRHPVIERPALLLEMYENSGCRG